VGVPGGKRGNVQTGRGGDRASTISLLGCSTSVALAMGPNGEEESVDEDFYAHTHLQPSDKARIEYLGD